MSVTESENTPVVEMRHINKAFGAVKALVDVDLVLYPGEILGLVGDNSAGKSTLMKIMTGAYHRDAGEVLVAGKPTHFRSPHESREVGIEMIYQDFALCGNMDVGQNIFLGRWPRRGLFVDRRKMYAQSLFPPIRQPRQNIHATYRQIIRIRQHQLRRAAAKQLGKGIAKDQVHLLHRLLKGT
jgi:simple sugar transport system ATP-binding protein